MEKIGVAAVVEGLSSFLGDMDKMDNSIRKLISPTNILGTVFSGLGDILTGLAGGVFRTIEYALGNLIAGAVTYLAGQLKELISSTIEAGVEFQKLELRLNQLNFNAIIESGGDFHNAQSRAIEQTKEQLTWLQRLAATTPYDNTDISNTYTLARGYGFVDDEARGLTESIIDFTSGMGLGNTEIVRIIKNFGQMRQLGKVMQRDLNDLATGAFVPVNDVLKKMRLEYGMTEDEMKDFLKTQEGVDAFINTFQKLVEQRFGGAAEKMARTFGAATDNLKDFIKSIVGLNIVKPVLDTLGARIAGFMDELTAPERWDAIVEDANRIGDALSGIVSDILGLAPDTGDLADQVVKSFDKIANWLEENRPAITEFVQGVVTGFRDELLPKIRQVWDFLFGSKGEPGAIQKFGAWLKDDLMPFIRDQVMPGVSDLINLITGKQTKKDPTKDMTTREDVNATPLENVVAGVAAMATALPSILELLSAIGDVIKVAFGGDETQTFSEFITNTLIPAIQGLTTFINDNRESLANLLKLMLAMEVIGYIAGLFLSLTVGVLGFLTAVGLLTVVGVIIGGIVLAVKLLVTWWEVTKNTFIANITLISAAFNAFKENIRKTFEDVRNAIKNGDWIGAGAAIIQGIARGITMTQGTVLQLASQLAYQALAKFQSIFKIKSPSAVMEDIGKNIVLGLAGGVEDSSRIAIDQMSKTAAAMLNAATPKMSYTMAPAMATQNTYQTNNTFNASFSSNTRNESLVQDFGMMASLVSG